LEAFPSAPCSLKHRNGSFAVRQAIDTKAINVSHSESLELVSKMLGAPDWNTLSALLQADRRNTLALSPICDTLIEGFSHFVTSMTAPDCFRLERLPGGACTHWNAPPLHGTHPTQTSPL
jgi:Glyoxalase superfamily protein